jgi:flagellar P-ring protein precursor FlgI
VNASFHKPVAVALDSGRVDINVADASEVSVPMLIARIQELVIKVHTPAKIVVNERTGTIVMGGDVKLSPVSVIHGSLSIQVVTSYTPVQTAGSLAGVKPPALVPQTAVSASDGPAQTMRLEEGANVDELVNGLHAIGTTAHDVVSILQAIKAEGGMQAELEIQ